MKSPIIVGDALEVLRTLPDASARCCVTSPPYWGLRDYGTGEWAGGRPDCDHAPHSGSQGATGERSDRTFTGASPQRDRCTRCGAERVDLQIGLEANLGDYLERIVDVFREVRRTLTDDGTLWLNLGDCYHGSGLNGGTPAVPGTLVRREPGRRGRIDAGLKPKDLVGIPWRVAFALQQDGWWLRSDIVWAKPNPMPESVTDRPTKSHEYIFLLTKSRHYYYDGDAVAEPIATDPRENYPARAKITGRGTQGAAAARGNDRDKSGGFPPRKKKRSGNKRRTPGEDVIPGASHVGRGFPWEENERGTRNRRSVWNIPTKAFPGAHFAVFPLQIPMICIQAGTEPGDTVLDPFAGAGTTGVAAQKLGREFTGIELNPEYAAMAVHRIMGTPLGLPLEP